MKTKFHRLLALLLALTMVLSMMPGVSLNVLADETEEPAPQPENVEPAPQPENVEPAPQPENVEPAPQAEPEHDFDWEHAEWVWAEDNSSAQLVAKCTTEGCEETDAVDADVTKETVAATCTENGSAVYTASVTLDDEEEPRTDIKTVVLPAPGHSFNEEGVCTVCDLVCEHDAEDELGNCTVCGVSLVSDEIMPLDVEPDEPDANYLTFTAEEAGSTISFSWNSGFNVQYRPGDGEWLDYTKGATITLEKVDDKVQFRGTNVTTNSDNHFSMTGTIAASGSVTSLLDGKGSNPEVAMTKDCFSSMFSGCTSLTTAPELPATTLAESCYSGMFSGCTSLTTAPELPATTLADYCYSQMFSWCNSLTTAPELPATDLAEGCYAFMFRSCTSLTTAPELPATELAGSCYNCMFYGCTSLTTAPELPATDLAEGCYNYMFNCCSSLNQMTLKNMTNPTPASMNSWLKDTAAGTLYIPEAAFNGKTTEELRQAYNVPDSWSIKEYANYLTFTAKEAGSTISFSWNSGFNVQYRPGDGEWLDYTKGATITLEKVDDTVSFKGNYVTTNSSYHFTMTGKIAASGSVTSLLDGNGTNPEVHLSTNCFKGMFLNCSSLTAAPDLPATTLASNCYNSMFYGCTGLTAAPELPATTLAYNCYQYMFCGCTSLTDAPKLPATTLANFCYYNMFSGCSSLTTAPELPAETLANDCYAYMFDNCTGLTDAPVLPAETLANDCYSNMFTSCVELTTAPALPAETLAEGCYSRMFSDCENLTTAPELPATTLADTCYCFMFANCSSLIAAPALPAVTLADNCYRSMFFGCTSLTDAPVLPAATMVPGCYSSMFANCSSLTDVPKLPISEYTGTYNYNWEIHMYKMFEGCTSLDQMTLKNLTAPSSEKMQYWLNSTAGTLYIPEAVLAGKTTADLRSMYNAPSNWSFKGVNAEGHCWEEAWQHNETHHWHQCEIRTCELTANNDIEHMGDYAKHDFRPAWRWVRQNNELWQAYCSLECVCGYCSDVLTATVVVDTTKEYITYTAKVTFGDQEFTSTKTEEIAYNVYYNSFHGQYKYATSIALFYNEADTKTNYEWYANGKLMATGNRYYFAVIEDVNVTSKKVEEVKPVLNLTVNDRYATNPGANDGKQSVKLSLQWSIPPETGYKFIGAGFKRAYSTAGTTLSVSQLTTKNATKLTTLSGTYNYTVSMSATTSLKTINVVGYLIYEDANGQQHTLETPIAQSVH